jgi:high-affinity Fe2+/Pb2+ permease
MNWPGQNKERQRFYLLAGMGGSAARRKHRRILGWAIVVGLVVSGVFAGLLFFLSRHSS